MTSPLSATDLRALEQAAEDVTREAGRMALTAFLDPLELEFKGEKQNDPVTAADREIENHLRASLKARYPDHGFLGEEHADDRADSSDFVWVMDPLDGTANFASGLPIWGISLGLLHKGKPVVGCIWVPVGPRLEPGVYHASRGNGAFFDDLPLSLEGHTQDERGRLIALPARSWRSFRFKRPAAGTPRTQRGGADPRSLGSITGEMVLVAAGVLRLAIFVQPKIWDVAAGGLIVQEAGGRALIWVDKQWQTLTEFVATKPSKGDGPAALRHWGRPILIGTPSTADRSAAALVWHPRVPQGLRKMLGLS